MESFPLKGQARSVTSHFFLFNIDESQLDPDYFDWLLRANYFADRLDSQAHGTTGYAAIRPKQFLSLEIPLPPLPEQQRIVADIEELARRVEEARGLRRVAVEEAEALRNKSLDFLIGDVAPSRIPLERLLREPLMNGLSIPASRKGSGILFAKVGIVNTGAFNPSRRNLLMFSYLKAPPIGCAGDIDVKSGATRLNWLDASSLVRCASELCSSYC